MTMNSSGPVSLGGAIVGQSINLENGNSATAQVSLNDTAVRNLAGVPSGAITMPTNFWGKSNTAYVNYTFSSPTANATLNLSTLPGYSAGKTVFTITVGSGIYLYATSTGGYGLNLTGGTTGDTLTLVNNGLIMGQGGAGGSSAAGNPGGPALNLGFGMASCTINNTNGSAYIGGGGGGGTGGNTGGGGGGGAGGGAGGTGTSGGGGGAGGGIGASGSTGAQNSGGFGPAGGGGGGRIFPGSGGAGGSSSTAASYGGSGGGAGGGGGGANTTKRSAPGGAGGGANAAGTNIGGTLSPRGGGGGGGWGASGGAVTTTPGGAGGKAVNTNGKSITWTSGDTARIYGSVS